MRNFYFFCMALLCMPQMWSQFTEDFDASTNLPAGWTVINQGSPNGWIVNDAPSGGARSGDNVMSIEYNDVAHDDYLISPSINVASGTNNLLEFYVRSRSGTFPEPYEVLLSTSGTNPSDFTEVLQSSRNAPTSWTRNSFFLDAYIGQTIYVAIRATGTDQFELYVDDFSVQNFTPVSNDECSGALPLTCGNTLTNQSTAMATGGSTNSCIGTIGNDVWYSFVATTEGARIIATSNTSGEELQVEVYESSDGSCSGFTLNTCSSSAGSGEDPVSFITPTTIGSTYYVRVGNWINGNPAVDFNIELECIACLPPLNLTSATIGQTSIGLAWDSLGSATSWDVEYGLTGFAQGSGTTMTANENPFTLEGLMPETEYDIYLRSSCSTGPSEWIGPLTLTTLCASVASSANVDLSSNPPNECWEEATSGSVAEGPMGIGASGWDDRGGYTDANGNNVESNSVNLYTTLQNEWLISPFIDANMAATAGDQLIVEVAVTSFLSSGIAGANAGNDMGPDDVVSLLISRNGGAWETLTTWTQANNPGANGTQFMVPLDSETGVVRFAVHASDGAVNDPEDYDFHVGRFELEIANLSTLELTNPPKLGIYPNPTSGELFIDSESEVKQVMVYNMLGKLVLSAQVADKVNVGNLPAGNYVIQVRTKDGLVTNKKFIKQ